MARTPVKDFRLEEGYQLETVTSFGKRQLTEHLPAGIQAKAEGALPTTVSAPHHAQNAAQEVQEAEALRQPRERSSARQQARDFRLDEGAQHLEILTEHGRRPVQCPELPAGGQSNTQLHKGDVGAAIRPLPQLKGPQSHRMPHMGLEQGYEKDMGSMQHSLHPNLALGYHGMPNLPQGSQIMLLPQQTAMMHQQHLHSLDFRHPHPPSRSA